MGRSVLCAVVGALAAVLGQGAAAQEVLKFAHIYPVERRDHQCATMAAERIAERTDGRYRIEVYPGAQLGGEVDALEGLALGTVDVAFGGSGFLAQVSPPIGLEMAAFTFRDYDHWKHYIQSDLARELAAGYEEMTGNKIVGAHYQGAWHVLSDEPISAPDDMQGLKMRVPNAEPWLVFPRAVGANATPIAYSEAYLALQQNVVDIMDQGLAGIDTMKFYEVRDTINLTNHLLITVDTIVGAPVWQRLSDQDKAIFEEVFGEVALECSDLVHEDELALIDKFREQGMTINEVDWAAFRDKVQPAVVESGGWSREQYDALAGME
jgi:tripartite ATP-independent transporter DctP family solute receptor